MSSSKDWDEKSKKYDQFRPFTMKFAKDAIELLKLNEKIDSNTSSILDVATGTGAFIVAAREYVEESVPILGVDYSEEMINVLKLNIEKFKLKNVSTAVMDGTDLKLDSNTFSHVGCVFGVMFFPDYLKGLKEFYRVLKPGGKVAIIVWKRVDSIEITEQIMKELGEPVENFTHRDMVYILGDEKKFKQAMEIAGFTDIEIHERYHHIENKFDNFMDMFLGFNKNLAEKYSIDQIKDALKRVESGREESLNNIFSGTALIAIAKK